MKTNHNRSRHPAHRGWFQKLGPKSKAFIAGLLVALVTSPAVSVEISQEPLAVGGNVPGNLALIPSVEFPTILSQANIGPYDVAREYMGYFDPNKCYLYVYSANEPDRFFKPVALAAVHTCADTTSWSGNFMNWAATQTIDPFRIALTGGNRVKDTATETWLQKARFDRSALSYYPDREITDTVQASGASPVSGTWGGLMVRINNLDHQMYFTRSATGTAILDSAESNQVAANVPRVRAYDPTNVDHLLAGKAKVGNVAQDDPYVYAVSIRVQVCVAGLLEPNCKQYSQGAKPEGLIQQYQAKLRYSIFGYLNDSDPARDGGVLRANQKYVGPLVYPPNAVPTTNAQAEWDPTTGVLIRNPDSGAAAATNSAMGISTIADSGVINYLNKFGEMTTKQHKSYDPVSELYYTAVRYFKNQAVVPEYNTVSGTADERYALADGFPVVTDWQDPIQFQCQSNVTLGIGDVYTHRDKNLPSVIGTSSANEPSKPALVAADATVDVVAATQKVAELEGITISNTDFTGRSNSAYIAGLAYDSHTKDIRPDVAGQPATTGKQTLSTFWVDVRENQKLENKAQNQYWLATKYGGFTVPPGFDPYTRTAPLSNSWWWTTGETLANSNGDPRPDNFYVASEADKMVLNLTRAFRKIIADIKGSGGSFAANTTSLETGAAVYQAQYYANSWKGELSSFAVDPATGAITASPTWQASDKFPVWTSRNIQVNAAGTLKPFIYSNLTPSQQTLLGSQAVVDYLRGDRSNEEPNGALRTRQGVLGDIINSQPVYVGKPSDRLYIGATFTGASTYDAYVTAQQARTPVVYVGANDGMLHGFNATTGVETVAFVPNAVFANLKSYTQPNYDHRYFVDGELTVADVYMGGAWKTVLVGTLGRGGRGMFALDVTDPLSVKLLWEKDSVSVPSLGNNLGKPIIAQVANGDWRVLLGNGPNSTTGSAQLVMVAISGGGVTTIDTGVGSDNGLTGVQAWDANKDGFTETAYAGDLKGNMWKIGPLLSGPTSKKVFVAKDSSGNAQPITAAPLVGRRPGTDETWVFFGTGKFLSDADLADKSVQTWYGIIDGGTGPLVQRSILAEQPLTTYIARVISEGTAADLAGKSGWYINLVSPSQAPTGERMVLPNQFQGFTLIGTSRIPDPSDPCKPAGRGFIMAIDPFTGARLQTGFFDVNGDGKVDVADSVTVNGEVVPVSGIGYKNSAPSNPTFVGDVMQVSLDDASKSSTKTYSAVMKVTRVAWRELLGD